MDFIYRILAQALLVLPELEIFNARHAMYA